MTVGLAVAVIRSTGIEGVLAADRSHAEGVRDEIRTLLRTAEEQATTAVHQALHDDVLGALAAIGASVGDDPVLRQRTGQVAARLQSPSTTAGGRERMPLGEVLRDLAGASSLGITTKAHGNPDEWPTLDDVRVGVVRRAVTEAVRNVERHAGVETALLEADFDAGWFRVDVTDAGKGFVPGLEGTWGRRHSIEEPVRSVGGRVSTVSTPGEGTTVTITWPAVGTEQRRPSRVQRVYWATRDAAPGSTPVVLTTVLCVLVAHIYLAIRYTWDRPSALWQLLNAAVLILVSIVSVRRLRMSPPTVPLVVGTSLMIATCVGVGLALAPPGSLRYYDSFVVGMAGVGLSAVAFFSDALTATLVTAPTMGVLSFFTIDDPIVGLADSLGAHLAVLAPVIGAYVIGAYLRRVSSRSTAEARRLAELSGSAYRIRADQAARQQLTQFTRDAVAPWLVGVASGVTPLGRPATTSRAGELARQVRDELYLGGVLDSVLRDRVAGARRDGVRIDFEAKDGAALAEAAIPLRLLDRLLDDTAQIDRIRVGVPTSEDGSWAVSVVTSAPTEPLAPLHAALSTMSHEVRKDSFATTVFGVIGRTPDGEPTLRGA
ncbi:MAG: hypothetical protein KBF94_17445 [Ilumatobacteraceae bacterium]|nr:hypothetical protein [Ilumatobacteraceae bacterium]